MTRKTHKHDLFIRFVTHLRDRSRPVTDHYDHRAIILPHYITAKKKVNATPQSITQEIEN